MSHELEKLDWQSTVSITRQQEFQRLRKAFGQAGLETPELDARLLLCHAGGFSHEDFIRDPDAEFGEAAFKAVLACEERRLSGEPVSRIVGYRSFWKHDFALNGETLDPRPDTEVLVEAVLAIIRAESMEAPYLADLGTGTGCIVLSLLGELAEARGVGIDVSGAAIDMAEENAERLGLHQRVDFVVGSWLEPVEGPFDIVVSNPPYIRMDEIASLKPEVSSFDPLRALDGGPDGLDAYRAIIPGLGSCLNIGGWVVFEVGAGQAEAVGGLLEAHGFEVMGPEVDWLCLKDLEGHCRIVAGKQRN